VDQAVEGGVHGIDRDAGTGGDPAGVRLIAAGSDEVQNGVPVLFDGSVDDRRAIKAEAAPELSHQTGGQRPASTENLGKRRVVGDEIAGESAEGIMRVALAALGEFGFETLSELHGGIMLLARKRSRWPDAKAGQTPRNHWSAGTVGG
jgi:hypothetical protein